MRIGGITVRSSFASVTKTHQDGFRGYIPKKSGSILVVVIAFGILSAYHRPVGGMGPLESF